MAPYWILAAYSAGIGLSAWVPTSDSAPPLLGAVCALAWLSLCRSRWATLPLAVAIILVGFLWAHRFLSPPARNDHVYQLVSTEPLAVTGTVHQVEQLWDGSSRLDIEIDRVGSGDAARAASGLVRLTVHEGDPGLWPGDRISWRARLRRPMLFGTPGEFDYPRYLAARGIYVTASVGRATDLARKVPEHATRKEFWARCRYTIANAITRTVPASEAGLLQALIVGIGSGISPPQRQQLSDGGLSHLFSISGLHFGLQALLLFGLCRWLYSRSYRLLLLAPPRRILPLALLLPLAGYLLLSGNAAPTRRAYAMTALGALLFACQRRTSPLALLATVALGMLIVSPLSLFEPSFQLSFAGVMGLIVWLPRWQHHLDGKPAWLRVSGTLLLTTLAATIATAPFAIWHFHRVAPAGLATNLIAIPLVAWGAVPAGLFGAMLLPLAPTAAGFCFTCAGFLVSIVMKITTGMLLLPGMSALPVFVTWRAQLALLALLVVVMLPWNRRRLFLLLGACSLIVLPLPFSAPAQLQVTALSVGQGDATLLSVCGRHYLVDGGGLTGSAIDIGERLVAPALGRLGASHLAGVILTHDHPDHSAGLPYILNNLKVDSFWSAIPSDQLDPHLAMVLHNRKIPAHSLPEGWTTLEDNHDATVSLFVPPQDAADPNDRSIVVYATSGGDGVLLTGDLAARGFQNLCASGLPGPVSLLKLPHHGSRGSRPEQFLDRLQPDLAFVSAGRDNPYGLPHPTSIAACRSRNIPLYRTDRQGTLIFSRDGPGRPWQVQCFMGVGD